MIHYSPFEQSLFRILCAQNTDFSQNDTIARLYLDAVAGAASAETPFTVYYPAVNHAELIVRQSQNQSLWNAKSIFTAECTRIIQRLQQTTDFLSGLLDNGYAESLPLPKECLPESPSGIGTEWRCYRNLSKNFICDLCFFRQVSIVIQPSAAEFLNFQLY